MFNLNFDICLVHFHAILAEITVLKRKQTPLERPRISWKGSIKTNWITVTIFSRLLFQLVGWFDEVSCSGSTLCWKKSRHERVSPKSYADNVVQRDFRVYNIDRDNMWWQQMNSNWSKILSIVWFHGQDVAFVLGDMHLLMNRQLFLNHKAWTCWL
jgi:hypothetical protein